MAQEGLPQIGWAKGSFPPDSADPGWPCGTPLWASPVVLVDGDELPQRVEIRARSLHAEGQLKDHKSGPYVSRLGSAQSGGEPTFAAARSNSRISEKR